MYILYVRQCRAVKVRGKTIGIYKSAKVMRFVVEYQYQVDVDP